MSGKQIKVVWKRLRINSFLLFLLPSMFALPIYSVENEQIPYVEKESAELPYGKVKAGSLKNDRILIDSIDQEILFNEKWFSINRAVTILSVVEMVGGLAILQFWVDEKSENDISNLPIVGLGNILFYGGGIQGLIIGVIAMHNFYCLKNLKAQKEKLSLQLSLSNPGFSIGLEVAF